MNGSTPIYDTAQTVVAMLAGPIVGTLFSLVVYRIMRRPTPVDQTLRVRAYYFYQMLSAILLGQFVCHTNWSASKFMTIFVVLGYFGVLFAERLFLVCNTNANITLTPDEEGSDVFGLDAENMEINNVIVADDLTDHKLPADMFAVLADRKDGIKRRFVLGGLVLLFSIGSVMNGIVMVYRPVDPDRGAVNPWAVVVCYYANVIATTLCVLGAMIHAQVHVLQPMRWRLAWWCGLTGVWIAVAVCSLIPMISGMQALTAIITARDVSIVVLYGIAAGMLLKIQQYFHQRKAGDEMERKDVFIGLLVFAISLAWSAVTSFFL